MPTAPGSAPGQPVQPVQQGHRSWDRREATGLALENGSQGAVHVYWLDDAGHEVRYFCLEPGERGYLGTWTSHPWVFRDAAAPQRRLVVQDQPVFYAPRLPPGAPSFVRWRAVIREPRQQRWAPALHCLADARFRGVPRALLLCHRRLAALRAVALPGRAWRGRLRSSSWLAAATLGDLPQVGSAGSDEYAWHAPCGKQLPLLKAFSRKRVHLAPSLPLSPTGAAAAHPASGRAGRHPAP